MRQILTVCIFYLQIFRVHLAKLSHFRICLFSHQATVYKDTKVKKSLQKVPPLRSSMTTMKEAPCLPSLRLPRLPFLGRGMDGFFSKNKIKWMSFKKC
jgi:hypothetical protein